MQSSVYAELRRDILDSTKRAVEQLCSEYVDEDHEMAKDAERHFGTSGPWAGGHTGGEWEFDVFEHQNEVFPLVPAVINFVNKFSEGHSKVSFNLP